MLNEAQAKEILQRVTKLVRTTKGAEGIATLTSAQSGNARFAVNEVTSSADVELTQLSVGVQFGRRSAQAITNQLDDRAIDEVVARAKRMAQLSPEDPETMPPLGKLAYKPAKNARDPGTATLAPAARAKVVAAALAAQTTAEARIAIAGFFEHTMQMQAIATTAGAWAHHAWTSAKLTCTARTADGTGSGWAGAASNRASDLDPAAISKIAVEKAVRSMKPARLDPGRYTVVLEPAAVADLAVFLARAFDARRADEGRSFFAKKGGGTRLGEKLFPEFIALRSNPTDPQLSSAPFDAEGLPLAPTAWVEKGTVRALAYGRYWAQKQGKPATGQPREWSLDGGTATREELIRGVKRGVLITRFWYLRSLDPQSLLVTGLTRDGVFLIENGAVTRPVNNFRFNESPVQMLSRCDALSPAVLISGARGGPNQVLAENNVRVPALRTHEFNLASISEAV